MKPPAGPPATATVDAQVRLILPAETVQELGLRPGNVVSLRSSRDAIVIRCPTCGGCLWAWGIIQCP